MTSATQPSTEPADTHQTEPSLYQAIASAVYKLASSLTSDRAESTAHARTALSRLRRAAGAQPGDDPIAWVFVMEDLLMNLPEYEIGRGDEPSSGEWAAFTAMTMFALHQQSHKTSMHLKRRSIGHALGELRVRSDSKSIKARFDALQTAPTHKALQYHLRSIVSMLNSYAIPLDYGLLGQDLKKLSNPKQRPGVIVRWGRDYVRALYPKSR